MIQSADWDRWRNRKAVDGTPFGPAKRCSVNPDSRTMIESEHYPGESKIDPGVAIGSSTLVHYARAGAIGSVASNPVFTKVDGEPGQHQRLTFAELDRKARSIATQIQQRHGAGKPVLVVLDPGVDYAAAIYGCMYAGAIAVPIYPPQMLRMQHTMPRLKAVIANAAAPLMISNRATIGETISPLWQLPHEHAIAVEEVRLADADLWQETLPSPDDVAILQYTSGSTGNPSGVILKHGTLINNMESLRHHFHFYGVRLVQWIPPYHDMGLVCGILIPVYVGVESVLLSPADFVRDPLLWLRCIDHYRGTSNGAPNFGFEFCVRKIKDKDCEGLDLSSWKVAVSGAEPIRAKTLERFSKKFAPYGFKKSTFCPSFGLAESVVFVSGSRLGETYRKFEVDSQQLQQGQIKLVADSVTDAEHTQTLVSSGTAGRETEIAIVDPESLVQLPDGQVGEIWIHGSSIAAGYWRDNDKTAKQFKGYILGDQSKSYLRTGDLGALIDGELVVTGRRKELIIVAGRNLYPHDVEQVVQSTSEAFKSDTGIAFGLEIDDSEQLVVVQEIWRPKKFDTDTLLNNAVTAIHESLQVTPYAIVLVRSGSMPKTSSGKLQRGDLRQMFVANDLPEVARWQADGADGQTDRQYVPPATETEKRIAAIWQDLLAVDEVSRDDDFFHLGGGSLLVAQLLTTVKEQTGVDLPLASLFADSTLQEFCTVIDSATSNKSSQPITQSGIADDQAHQISTIQERFWLLSQLEQSDAFLHVPVSVHLASEISLSRLQNAVDQILIAHPMLRTAFADGDERVTQTIQKSASLQIEVCNARDQQEFKTWKSKFVAREFDLSSPPLLRVGLWNHNVDSCIELVFHHIACDASSVELILKDLQNAFGGSEIEPTDRLRYVDFCQWDQSDDRQQNIESALQYWTTRLDGVSGQQNVPRTKLQSQKSATPAVHAALPTQLAQQIRQFAVANGATASMVYLSALELVLSRYTNSSDVTIALPTSNRPATALASTVGCYVNQLVYRANVDSDLTFGDALRRTKTNLLQDLEHGHVPFQKVVDSVPHQRLPDVMPLAQTMFLYQPEMKSIESLGDVQVTRVLPDYSGVTAYDLSLIVHPAETTELTLVHGDTVDPNFAQRGMDSIVNVLEQLVQPNAVGQKLSDLQVLAKAEQAFLQESSMGSAYELGDSVLNRLGQFAAQTPDALAVVDDTQRLTFAELDELTTRIAGGLIRQGVQAGSLVGIRLSRSADLVIAVLSIWKAGSAYVPLDPKLPEGRIAEIMSDASIGCVLDSRALNRHRDSPDLHTTLPPLDTNQLAYVIFTSGSTGRPKGVAIEHSSVSNLMESFSAEPGFKQTSKFLAITTLAFDISVLEMFLPIWAGGTVHVVQQSVSDSPEAVISKIQSSGATHIQSTPSTFRMLFMSGWKPKSRLNVWCGGEPMTPGVAEQFLAADCELWNVYGPTETTVWSSVQRIKNAGEITIGRAIGNTELVVLDNQNQIAPLGVVGELCIGGRGLARGYWNRPELSAEKFIELGGRRLYRTGDQAHRRCDGELVFLSRNDRQVKLRGFRVELDEIESVLQQHPDVQRAAVVLQSAGNNKTLHAFCQTNLPQENAKILLSFAAQKLPNYMMPLVHCVSEIKENNAGKTDYRALLLQAQKGPRATPNSQQPRTPMEKDLAKTWCEVLEIPNVGRDENFFELGGNSLMAAQLFSRVRERFNVKLPLKEVYKRPTVESLAALIIQQQSQVAPDEFSELLAQIDSLSEEEAINALVNENDS